MGKNIFNVSEASIVSEASMALFSNSAEYLNYLLTSNLGFHMLHFDILIGWVPVLIFVQTGWIVCFGGFKTANGKLSIPIQASLFFYKQCNQANVVITWKYIYQVLYQDQIK